MQICSRYYFIKLTCWTTIVALGCVQTATSIGLAVTLIGPPELTRTLAAAETLLLPTIYWQSPKQSCAVFAIVIDHLFISLYFTKPTHTHPHIYPHLAITNQILSALNIILYLVHLSRHTQTLTPTHATRLQCNNLYFHNIPTQSTNNHTITITLKMIPTKMENTSIHFRTVKKKQ